MCIQASLDSSLPKGAEGKEALGVKETHWPQLRIH